MRNYIFLDDKIWFPSHEYADSEGLLAVGGDLSAERLMLAYANGIFPWYGEENPILWWSPDPRFVLFLKDFHLTKKQRKLIEKSAFLITENRCFDKVIELCANVKRKNQEGGTWINNEMRQAYIELHQKRIAHSMETWSEIPPENSEGCYSSFIDGKKYYLAGGLYGILTPHVFCGESMFSLMPEASRAALDRLVGKLKDAGHILIDCQIESPHFVRMGARNISRKEFLAYLHGVNP